MEQSFYRKTWAEIDLDAIEHNVQQIKHHLPSKSKIFAVVKADAYGHGAVKVAQKALQSGADFLAVALLEEALELREAGIKEPILVFGRVDPSDAKIAAQHEITLTAFQTDWLKQVNHMISTELNIHINLDTGMGRVGVQTKSELKKMIDELKQSNCIKLTGVYTHFATADDVNVVYFQKQKERFDNFVTYFQSIWDKEVFVHCANSAATMRDPNELFDVFRIGVSMYGLYPSAVIKDSADLDLRQAFSLHSRLIHVKKISKGQSISYGATYTAEQEEWIGTIPIGYADGLIRKLQGSHVLIQGKRHPIVGRISMDHTMIRLDQHYDIGTKVTLIGKQEDEEILVDEIAASLETINYEIPCMISSRVPRFYHSVKEA